VSELREEYLFALAHLCHVDVTKPLKLRDLFNLVLGIDAYIEEQKRGQQL
jgi:hypothetical protein